MEARAKDVVVIGGGVAGLTAAAFAARAGHRVTLIEKARSLGGRAATAANKGFSLNFGAHALYLGGPAQRALDDLGVAAPGGSPPREGYAWDGERARTLPTGFVSLLTTSLLPLGAKLEVARLLAGIGSIDAGALAGVGASAWIDRAIASPGAREVLRAYARVATYAGDLDRLSAGVVVAQIQQVNAHDVRYVDGGWATIVAGLRSAAEHAGVRIVVGEKASRIEIAGGRVARVLLASGAALAADAVIVAATPRAASALAPESEALHSVVETAIPVEATTVDLALSRLPNPRVRFALGVKRPVYFSVHSASANLAPEGGAVVHTIFYREGGEDPDLAVAELERMIEALQPGYRDAIVARQVLPKVIVTHALPTAAMGGLAGRPAVRVPDCEGLLLAGDWVGPSGLLAEASFASARAAVDALVAIQGSTRRDAEPISTHALR